MLAPAYPGFEVEVEALNADPSPVEKITIPGIVAHLESVVGALDTRNYSEVLWSACRGAT